MIVEVFDIDQVGARDAGMGMGMDGRRGIPRSRESLGVQIAAGAAPAFDRAQSSGLVLGRRHSGCWLPGGQTT